MDLRHSSIESKISHKRGWIQDSGDTPLNVCWVHGEMNIDINLSSIKIENKYCLDLPAIQKENEDCSDLLSTCSSLILDEDTDESKSSGHGDSSFEKDILFQEEVFHKEESQNNNNSMVHPNPKMNKTINFQWPQHIQ